MNNFYSICTAVNILVGFSINFVTISINTTRMKNIYILSVLVSFLLFGCTTQNTLDKATVERLISEQAFTFHARKALPMNYDVVNAANSLPGGYARLLDLDPGYTLQISRENLSAQLPYFGRSYSGTFNRDQQGHYFDSKSYSYNVKNSSKSTTITMQPNDISNIQRIFLDVYPNGRAYLSIDAVDRQPISYEGYITAVEKSQVPK